MGDIWNFLSVKEKPTRVIYNFFIFCISTKIYEEEENMENNRGETEKEKKSTKLKTCNKNEKIVMT